MTLGRGGGSAFTQVCLVSETCLESLAPATAAQECSGRALENLGGSQYLTSFSANALYPLG